MPAEIKIVAELVATVVGGTLTIAPLSYVDGEGEPADPPSYVHTHRGMSTVSTGKHLPDVTLGDEPAVAWSIDQALPGDHRNFYSSWPLNGEPIWRRPADAMPAWEWIPDDPDDPQPREGHWSQTETGYRTPMPEMDYPSRTAINWWNESSNNWTVNDEIRIDCDGPMTLVVQAKNRPEIIVWGGAADINVDGKVNHFDFIEFQNLFGSEDLRADYDGNGELTFFDFAAFQNAFAAGTADDVPANWPKDQFEGETVWLPRVFEEQESDPLPGPDHPDQ